MTSVRTLTARIDRIEAARGESNHSGVELMSDDELRRILREAAAESEQRGDLEEPRLLRELVEDTISAADMLKLARIANSPELAAWAPAYGRGGR